MRSRWWIGLLVVALLVVGVLAAGSYGYNMGLVQGAAQSGQLTPGIGPVPYGFWGPYGIRPFGYGFGLLGCLFPLFFVFLIFALVRGLFWRGRGWGMHNGQWRDGVPPRVEEWHRRLHEAQGPGPQEPGGPA